MDLLPNNLRLGWVVGSGREGLPESEIDFILTTNTKELGVQGRHCRFNRNLQTGVLLAISDGRKVIVDGKDVLCKRRDRGTVKEKPQAASEYQQAMQGRTGIVIGDLSYLVEFTSLPEAVQQRQLEKASVQFRQATPSAFYMSPTPSALTYEYHGYMVYPVTAGGISSAVAFSYSKVTGNPIVMERMERGSRDYEDIKMEIQLLRALSHVSALRRLEAARLSF